MHFSGYYFYLKLSKEIEQLTEKKEPKFCEYMSMWLVSFTSMLDSRCFFLLVVQVSVMLHKVVQVCVMLHKVVQVIVMLHKVMQVSVMLHKVLPRQSNQIML